LNFLVSALYKKGGKFKSIVTHFIKNSKLDIKKIVNFFSFTMLIINFSIFRLLKIIHIHITKLIICQNYALSKVCAFEK